MGDSVDVDQSLNSVDTELMVFGNNQFLTYVIIKPIGSHMVVIPLHTILWGMIGRLILFVGHSGKGSLVYTGFCYIYGDILVFKKYIDGVKKKPFFKFFYINTNN